MSRSKYYRVFALIVVIGSLTSIAIQSIGCSSTPPALTTSYCPSMLGSLPGPTTEPQTQPTSNGVDTHFADDLATFREVEDSSPNGLGPVFNANSCAACHQNTAFGETSQISVIRAGHRDRGKFIEPPGGSLMFQRAIHPDIQVHVRPEDEIRTLRMTTNVLGDGYIECVDDQAILTVQSGQPASMQGTIVLDPVPLRPANPADKIQFVERIGRFGWKSQDASLLAFSAGAYLNEMGVTSPLQPTENTSLGRDTSAYNPMLASKPIQDPNLPFGDDVEAFTAFMRSSNPPPRAKNLDAATVQKGSDLFDSLQCAVCHVRKWTTVSEGTVLGDFTVPKQLSKQPFYPFSDFMLHDVGTGDGIVQTQHAQRPAYGCDEDSVKPSSLGKDIDAKAHPHVHRVVQDMYKYVDDEKNPKHGKYKTGPLGQRYMDSGLVETATMIRTPPLWGLRVRPQLMHDGLSLTLEEAIRRHANQGQASKEAFLKLSDDDRCELLTFLMSL